MLLVFFSCGSSWLSAAQGIVLSLDEAHQRYSIGGKVQHRVQDEESEAIRSVINSKSLLGWETINEDVPNLGYSQATHWFQIIVENNLNLENWKFVVEYPLIRALDLYVIRSGEVAEFFQVGDRFEYAARPIDHRNFIFPLSMAKGERVKLLFRIKSAYAIQFPAYFISETQYLRRELNNTLLHGLFFGFLLVMLLYNLFIYSATREVGYFWYVCFTASVGLFQLAQHGFGYEYLWSTNIWWQHRSAPVSCCLAFIFAVIFVQSFLQTRKTLPVFHQLLSGMLLAAVGLLFLALFVSEYYAQYVNANLGVVGALLIFSTSFAGWRAGSRDARIFMLAWLVFLIAIVAFAGNKLGFLPRNFWTEYGIQMGTAIELALLSFALADRLNSSRKNQEALLEKSREYEQMARLANEKALAVERLGKERLEKSIKARTEQLQNALKELTEVNQQLEEMSNLDHLTGVKSQAYFEEKASEEWGRGAREQTWISLVLVSIDQFELIGDRYGYVAAEEILKNVSELLAKRVSRPADLVGRVGNSEFGILMPNTDIVGARFVAKDIFKEIAKKPLNLGVCSLSVTVSVSVAARKPALNTDVNLLLDAAKDTLMAVIECGGNGVAVDDGVKIENAY